MRKAFLLWMTVAVALLLGGALLFGGVMSFLEWDFGRLSTMKLETTVHEPVGEISSIYIDTKDADVAFLPAEGEACRVVCYENVKMKHTVTIEEGTLFIRAVDNRKMFDYINILSGNPMLTVYLPKAVYHTLTVKTTSGDLGVPADFSFTSIDVQVTTGDVKIYASATGEMKLKATTGDLFAENVSAGSLSCSVTTGDVTLNGVQCTGDMSVGAGTGDINFNGVSCNDLTTSVRTGDTRMTDVSCNNLSTSGTTGDLFLKNVIGNGRLYAKRSTGDVSFDACDAAELSVDTGTGDVTGTLCSDKVFAAHTKTGECRVPASGVGGVCEVRVNTGDIILTVLG